MAENSRETNDQEQSREAGKQGQSSQRVGLFVPGQRLTGAEAEAELGKPQDRGTNKNADHYDPARTGQPGGAEREALRVQHPAGADRDEDMPSAEHGGGDKG